MDLDLTIRYSDDGLCEVVVWRAGSDAALSDCHPSRAARRKHHRCDARSATPPRNRSLALTASSRRLNRISTNHGANLRVFERDRQFPEASYMRLRPTTVAAQEHKMLNRLFRPGG
jgi:hypothetical protein